jgi:hypothetical protein
MLERVPAAESGYGTSRLRMSLKLQWLQFFRAVAVGELVERMCSAGAEMLLARYSVFTARESAAARLPPSQRLSAALYKFVRQPPSVGGEVSRCDRRVSTGDAGWCLPSCPRAKPDKTEREQQHLCMIAA